MWPKEEAQRQNQGGPAVERPPRLATNTIEKVRDCEFPCLLVNCDRYHTVLAYCDCDNEMHVICYQFSLRHDTTGSRDEEDMGVYAGEAWRYVRTQARKASELLDWT